MQDTEIVTMDVRLSYPNIWEPRAVRAGNTPKYSAVILIPKDDKTTQERVKNAIQAAVVLGRERYGEKAFKVWKNPVHDGAEKADPNYEDCFFLNAKNSRQPKVVDRRLQPILDREEIYPGVVVRAQLGFYPYNHPEGGRGVGVSLNSIQKVRDAAPFAGVVPSVEEAFTVLEDDSPGASDAPGGAFDAVNIFG